ncbi:hypothetical protein [Mycolicibacterium sphagni]|uniref:hypothetical protein n=1 Tax=Mycolicibacterium sphagni TaxID=1786 RepID=UPI0021F283F3|nr:hypothetical protein [Mycolicibacterium sphagni]MCV7176766.1 hypothetical protein [Mycolicibacterium sphagni]
MSPPAVQLQTATGGSTSTETLIKHAHKLLTNCGICMSPAKVSRLVREFKHRVERNGFPFEAFLVNSVDMTNQQRLNALADPEIARVISYLDPTGELAVMKVLRAQRATR